VKERPPTAEAGQVVNLGAMKSNHAPRKRRFNSHRRARFLAAFDRSGLSAAAFARKHNLHYTTFCGWRQRRDQSVGSPEFVQVELPIGPSSLEVTIEMGRNARVRVHSADQIPLVAALLVQLTKEATC